MEEFKTTVISYGSNPVQKEKEKIISKTTAIQKILYNKTDESITRPINSIPATQVQLKKLPKGSARKTIQEINPKSSFMPKFYLKELRRHYMVVWLWVALTIACTALESWALVAILQNETVNNWVALTLIPLEALCIAFLVMYANKYINYRNEARSVDFEGKPVTICVRKLYIRLKSAHINANWFCGLFYVLGLYCVGICYLVAGFLTNNWGDISPENLAQYGGPAILITVICAIVTVFIAFFMHIFLLVTSHARAGKIDAYYTVQIVSDEELKEIKKQKNKRDMIIFFAIVMILVLVGLLIYRLVKSRKVNNNVTITNV